MSARELLCLIMYTLASCTPRLPPTSTTLRLTAQRNDTGTWTTKFGDYQMIIEHKHFNEAQSQEVQDGTWTLKVKHTSTEYGVTDENSNKQDIMQNYNNTFTTIPVNNQHTSVDRVSTNNQTDNDDQLSSNNENDGLLYNNNDYAQVDQSSSNNENDQLSSNNQHGQVDQSSSNNENYQLSSNNQYGQDQLSNNNENGQLSNNENDQLSSNYPYGQDDQLSINNENDHLSSNNDYAQVDILSSNNENGQLSNNNENYQLSSNDPYGQDDQLSINNENYHLSSNNDYAQVDQVSSNNENYQLSSNNENDQPSSNTQYGQVDQLSRNIEMENVTSAVDEMTSEEREHYLAEQERKLIMDRYPRSRSLGYDVRELDLESKGYRYYPEVGWIRLNTAHWQWDQARKSCEMDGGQLAVPDTLFKIKAFTRILKDNVDIIERAVLKNQVFVGVYVPYNNRKFITVKGEPFTPESVSIWFPNEPNDADPGEDCVTLHLEGKLRDVPCFYNLPFLCQIH